MWNPMKAMSRLWDLVASYGTQWVPVTPFCVIMRPGANPTNGISIEFEFRSKFAVLWFATLNRPQQNFVHVTTMLLSWHEQNFAVTYGICYQQEHHYKISLNFEFDRNIVSGTGGLFAPYGVTDLVNIGSRIGLSPLRRKAIADIFSLGANFSEMPILDGHVF